MNGGETLHVGICGCGAIARAHARVLADMPGTRLHAYADIAREKADAFLREFGGDYATADVRALADDPALDAVYVCTLHHRRLDILRTLAEAGKAVFMEKPLTHDLPTLIEMGRILEQYPTLFQAGYKIRFHSLVGKARALLPEPEFIVAHVLDEVWPENPLNQLEIGGGNVRAQGVYAAELLHVLAGSLPVAVTALAARRRHASRIEDTLGAVYEFANGAIGVAAVADAGQATDGVSKFFAEAVGGNRALTLLDRFQRLEWRDQTATASQVLTAGEDGFARQSAAFLASVREGAPVQCSFPQGAIPSLMIYRALESADSGRRMNIDIPTLLRNG